MEPLAYQVKSNQIKSGFKSGWRVAIPAPDHPPSAQAYASSAHAYASSAHASSAHASSAHAHASLSTAPSPAFHPRSTRPQHTRYVPGVPDVPCTLYPVPCALCPTPYALRPTPCALRPTPYALRPTPCALCPALAHPVRYPVPCVPCALPTPPTRPQHTRYVPCTLYSAGSPCTRRPAPCALYPVQVRSHAAVGEPVGARVQGARYRVQQG